MLPAVSAADENYNKGIDRMKELFSKRTLIIICIPALFVLIILTIGIPQQLLTAVDVGSEKYNIAAYNYYYYEAYYSFVTEHQNELADLGLNVNGDLDKQNYDDTTTWAEYFRQIALANMQEYAVLNNEAESAGYDASEEVESVRAENEENIRTYCVNSNISDPDKYLSQVYDGGMNEKIFYAQLANRTSAESYRTVVKEQLTPTDDEVEEYRQKYYDTSTDYLTADVVVTYFVPGTDRSSGETEEHQWENAGKLAEAAHERAEANGGDLDAYIAVATQFSELEDDSAPDGHFSALTKDDVEDVLEAWCFDESRQSGDSVVLRDDTGWYLVYFNGWGESALTVQARDALIQERYDQWLNERETAYPVKTHGFAMIIAR
jgi:hypothetical protein